MSTAKKTLFAALGAGTVVLDAAKEIPSRVISLPGTVTSRVTELPTQIQQRVDKVRSSGGIKVKVDVKRLAGTVTSAPDRASGLISDVRKGKTDVQKRAQKTFKDYAKKGEKTFKQVQKSRSKTKKTAKRKPSTPKVAAPMPTTEVTSDIAPANGYATSQPSSTGQQSL